MGKKAEKTMVDIAMEMIKYIDEQDAKNQQSKENKQTGKVK